MHAPITVKAPPRPSPRPTSFRRDESQHANAPMMDAESLDRIESSRPNIYWESVRSGLPHLFRGTFGCPIWGLATPQIAVFVDAGYLYAQGSTLLNGRKLGREPIRLSVSKALAWPGPHAPSLPIAACSSPSAQRGSEECRRTACRAGVRRWHGASPVKTRVTPDVSASSVDCGRQSIYYHVLTQNLNFRIREGVQ